MSPVIPNPSTWTLRLKHHKTTVLLHADPLQGLDVVKEELLSILRETTDGQLNGNPLPDDYHDILLARPVDMQDLDKGWVRIEDLSSEGKSAARGRGRRPAGGSAQSLKVLGVKENAVLVFKFREASKEQPAKVKKAVDDLGLDDEDEVETEQWDVIIPTYEDTYGVENVGDIGASKDFTG